MHAQSSYQSKDGRGQLYLVGTPIGNLEDMTYRAIRILQEVDMIAAEDTRNTIKLCNHFAITTPLMSYHDHNQMVGGEKILALLEEGKSIALVSDAGMPCISDPGVDIAMKAIDAAIDVIPVPGANAAITALIASGLPSQPFTFYGFLPRNKKERAAALDKLCKKEETIILYEAPHRLKETLKAMQAHFEPTRRIVLARELTKKFEEFLRGTLEEAVEWAQDHQIRGEFCLVIERGEAVEDLTDHWWQELSIQAHVDAVIVEKGVRSKEAIQEVAKSRQMSKRDVYQAYHVE